MQITDIRIKKVETGNRLKAIASVTIDDCFAIHELRVIEGKEGLFVAMPSRQTTDGVFRDIVHPIDQPRGGTALPNHSQSQAAGCVHSVCFP